jgi:hypothetical protein
VYYALLAGLLALFGFAVRRQPRLWIAEALGFALIAFGPEATCYYYSFFVLVALLARAARPLEWLTLVTVAASALAVAAAGYLIGAIDRYATQSAIFVGCAVVALAVVAWRRPARLPEGPRREAADRSDRT